MSNHPRAIDNLAASGYVAARERRDNCAGCARSYATDGGHSGALWCIVNHARVASGGWCSKIMRQSDLDAPWLADQSAAFGVWA